MDNMKFDIAWTVVKLLCIGAIIALVMVCGVQDKRYSIAERRKVEVFAMWFIGTTVIAAIVKLLSP